MIDSQNLYMGILCVLLCFV